MKDFSSTSFILLVLFLNSIMYPQFLNGPESVVYDLENGRYLISNVHTGNIVQINDVGDTTFFNTSPTRTLGMTIVDSLLYVADISGLVTFNLKNDQNVATKYIPGMIELNDITADTSGYLYITDIGAGKIFRVKISDHSDTTIVNGIAKPNGILFDAKNNRILFCQFIYNASIKQINLNDFSVTTIVSTPFANFDGLAIDSDDNIYVSCWGNNSIYRYNNDFNIPEELISSSHSGPADIFYNLFDSTLAIPNYYSNHVDFIKVSPTSQEEIYNPIPVTVSLSQNYPNPFNPETTIQYSIPKRSVVLLKVYDMLGNEVVTLADEEKDSGVYTIVFDGSELASGMYLYQLRAGSFVESRKLILVK